MGLRANDFAVHVIRPGIKNFNNSNSNKVEYNETVLQINMNVAS